MKTKTSRVAAACFTGGFVCTLLALLVAPGVWWLGIPAGFAAGYLAYDLRGARLAVPQASALAKRAAEKMFPFVGRAASISWRWWRTRPHPLLWPAVIISAFITSLTFTLASPTSDLSWDWAPLIFVIWTEASGCVIFILFVTGARKMKRCPAVTSVTTGGEVQAFSTDKGPLAPMSIPMTYRNFYSLVLAGLLVFLRFLFVLLPKWTAIGIGYLFYFFAKFLWWLFRLVHSHERVLCGVDGALGGVAAFFMASRMELTGAERLAAAVAGGLMGAAIGVLNYKLVSVRWLKLAASSVGR